MLNVIFTRMEQQAVAQAEADEKLKQESSTPTTEVNVISGRQQALPLTLTHPMSHLHLLSNLVSHHLMIKA